jgi:AmmeMemoRadiSam system protein B
MKFRNYLLLIFLLLSLSICVFLYGGIEKPQDDAELLGISNEILFSDQNVHRNLPFDKNDFFKAVLEASDLNRDLNYHVYGGVIPHHLLPSFVIADFFKNISHQKIQTIVLIGPDHYEEGSKHIITSSYYWETDFGIIEPDLKTINGLVSNKVLEIDEKTVRNDHSIYGILPFIKYYIPDAKIVPVLVSGYSSKEEIELFVESSSKYYSDNMIVVASVDFSHYLNSEEARANDKETISIIERYDYEKLFNLNSDFIDSPASMAVVMMMMQKYGKTNMEILQHLNSSDITRNVYGETTSYFSIYYY